MVVSALLHAFRQVALFQGLKPLQITEIARRAERVVIQPGREIIRDGEAGDAAYLVIGGTALRLVRRGGAMIEEHVPSATLIGEMAMLVETQHAATIIAGDKVRALRITRAGLQAQMLEDPSLTDHFIAKVADRLHAIASELRRVDQIIAGPPAVVLTGAARDAWPGNAHLAAAARAH